MSLDVGDLVANLRVSTKQASTDLAKGETALTKQATGTGSKMGGGLSKGITGALKAGLGIAAGFIAFKSVTEFLHSSIDAAEALNESTARTEVVFGKSTKTVEQWAAHTDQSFGLSKQAALEYASQLGNVTKVLGFSTAASAQMAQKTTELAVQVAAFKKTDPSTVIAAITAGYRGQYKGLAKLIPGINATTVEQEALNETGKSSAKLLTAQEKATATLTLAQKNGADATTFYNGEAQKLSREQKVFNAELDNMKASIGQVALPLLTALAHIAATQVLPAIQEAGGALVDLAHAINALPTPVKAAGAGLLALVLLGPEIRELADSVGQNLSGAFETARIQALYMQDAFHQAGGGVTGLAKSIGLGAGAGLRGAAKGLLSVIGGPWGAAFIGASAAVGVLISVHQKAKQLVESYTNAIKADSGALGENTRAAVANALSQGDSFKQAKTLGISLSDLTDDLLGNAAAHERVAAAIQAGSGPDHDVQGRLDMIGQAARGLNWTLGDQTNALHDATGNAKDFASAMGPAQAGQDDLGNTVAATTSDVVAQTAAVKTWIERIDAATGKVLDVRAANRGWQQALDDASKALHDNGRTLNTNTQKGRDNAAALDAIAKAALDRADANKAAGRSDQFVNGQLETSRDRLIKVAEKFGLSKKQAKAYADQLLNIPKVVPTTISAPGLTRTIAQVQALKRELGSLDFHAFQKDSAALTVPNTPKGTPAPSKKKPKISANGNIFYADGGENHTAQIGDGTTRIWDEPETQGEAYIPFALSKRARSTAIWKETGRRMGLFGASAGMSGPLVSIGSYTAQHGPADFAAELRFALREAGI